MNRCFWSLGLLAAACGSPGPALEDVGSNADASIDDAAGIQDVSADDVTMNDGDAIDCTSNWGELQYWKIVWVVPGVTDLDGENLFMRLHGGPTGDDHTKCSTYTTGDEATVLDCTGGVNPLRAAFLAEATTWELVFDRDPSEPGIAMLGTVADGCENVVGRVVFGALEGEFTAMRLDLEALGWELDP